MSRSADYYTWAEDSNACGTWFDGMFSVWHSNEKRYAKVDCTVCGKTHEIHGDKIKVSVYRAVGIYTRNHASKHRDYRGRGPGPLSLAVLASIKPMPE